MSECFKSAIDGWFHTQIRILSIIRFSANQPCTIPDHSNFNLILSHFSKATRIFYEFITIFPWIFEYFSNINKPPCKEIWNVAYLINQSSAFNSTVMYRQPFLTLTFFVLTIYYSNTIYSTKFLVLDKIANYILDFISYYLSIENNFNSFQKYQLFFNPICLLSIRWQKNRKQ